METLTQRFISIMANNEENREACLKAAEMVLSAPSTPESTGLLAYMYHEGIGVDVNLDRCFELAEEAAFKGGDALGYFLLGYMCDNAETPDQAEGGPRQKYDHYDAERFYEKCAEIDSPWSTPAHLWLGDYYMDMAQGGDPEIGVEHYEAVAEDNDEAAGRLSDYYWNLVMPEYFEDEEWCAALFKWTEVAARLNPEEYSYRMGWIYADGFGCEKSFEKAIHFFEEAYNHGDWRGAKAVAQCYEEFILDSTEPGSKERAGCEQAIKEWNERADRMREDELLNDPDNCVEED